VYQLQRCLVRLDEVVAAGADPVSAYVARTRLQRMLVAVSKVIQQKVASVDHERRPSVLEGTANRYFRVQTLIDEIVVESRHLARRSESLDARWRDGWGQLQDKIEDLRAELSTLYRDER
jgi:hypothetical protein